MICSKKKMKIYIKKYWVLKMKMKICQKYFKIFLEYFTLKF